MPAVILIRAIVRCPLIVSTILPLAYHVSCFFITKYNSYSQRTHTHTSTTYICKPYSYKHLQRLDRQILEIGEVTQASHCRWECRLPLKHSAIKFENIRFHTESNPGPEVLPRLVTTRLDALSRL